MNRNADATVAFDVSGELLQRFAFNDYSANSVAGCGGSAGRDACKLLLQLAELCLQLLFRSPTAHREAETAKAHRG